MDMDSRWVAFYEILHVLVLASYALMTCTMMGYIFVQYRFLRYLRVERPRDYARLGKPDEITRMTEDGGYFSVDRFVFRKEYLSIPDAHAQWLGKKLRELLLASSVLLVLGTLCILVLWFS